MFKASPEVTRMSKPLSQIYIKEIFEYNLQGTTFSKINKANKCIIKQSSVEGIAV